MDIVLLRLHAVMPKLLIAPTADCGGCRAILFPGDDIQRGVPVLAA